MNNTISINVNNFGEYEHIIRSFLPATAKITVENYGECDQKVIISFSDSYSATKFFLRLVGACIGYCLAVTGDDAILDYAPDFSVFLDSLFHKLKENNLLELGRLHNELELALNTWTKFCFLSCEKFSEMPLEDTMLLDC